jgi:hypothetical protein
VHLNGRHLLSRRVSPPPPLCKHGDGLTYTEVSFYWLIFVTSFNEALLTVLVVFVEMITDEGKQVGAYFKAVFHYIPGGNKSMFTIVI